ncbi:3-hydroxyacyl-ACP dehydratase FabZ family protein [Reichenbachiella sp. MALMAid0571]|uniref:3-hydroxyacyl-ACP dehydratase FabZ family protein n=1 Tax=Reichenbachiella sp. MALMAid0571 TaxID=3143939 RepID=UPI0032DFF7AE
MYLSKTQILELIPHREPFRFIDEILEIDNEHVVGVYTFKEDEYFYKGHFPTKPVTPGVIVTEAMAQIGLVTLGIYLLADSKEELDPNDIIPVFTSSNVDFLSPIYPGEKLVVKATKVYFRFGKLKAKIIATNESKVQICKGEFSGMFVSQKNI